MEAIPGDTRVAIERLLTYINDIGTITNYLQVPREWVEHTKRNSRVKSRPREIGLGQPNGEGHITMLEKSVPKSIALSTEALLKAQRKAFLAYAQLCGQTPDFVMEQLMMCRDPLASRQESDNADRRKEAGNGKS